MKIKLQLLGRCLYSRHQVWSGVVPVFSFCLVCLTGFGQGMSIGGDMYVGGSAEMYIAARRTVFDGGVVMTSRKSGSRGLVGFSNGSVWEEADNSSYVDGYVRMYDGETFSFPVGDGDSFQPAKVVKTNEKATIDIAFNFEAPNNLEALQPLVRKISDRFYWTVFGDHPSRLSLSWNSLSGIEELTGGDIGVLGIAGYDGDTWLPIESKLDDTSFHDNTSITLDSGSITFKSPVDIGEYEAFTLAVVDPTFGIKVSQGFTPNGDGINDVWYIEGLEKHPNTMIKVFNRSGQEVFSFSGHYQNDWGGTYKNNKRPLPDSSYLYVIDLDGDGVMDLRGWMYITR